MAIIGCGAVSERCHLPALARLRWAPTLLVDRDLGRAQRLAKECGARASAQWEEALTAADAVIVALPHHLHASVGVPLLEAGKHLLLEKPMALDSVSCRALNAAAQRGGAVLAVGHVRRFLPAMRWVQAALAADLLDGVQSFDARDGAPYGWPAQSDFFWKRETAGGGVTIDIGAHVLDLVLWCFGPVLAADYRDDAYGGVEAEAEVRLRLSGHRDGLVELSRTRQLRNTLQVRGSKGSLEVGLYGQSLTAVPTGLLERSFAGLRGDRLPRSQPEDIFVWQLQDWLGAISAGRSPLVPGLEAAATVDLIEALYAARQPWELPWVKGGQP
ncbi:MAG: Gfo/Idh/MocA family oxidoreductase [Fimbriimonadaceae bacterium]|nr:Gfo/Idh/MocA family oxidoreductase [Fimbriimonadaceae bacterium]